MFINTFEFIFYMICAGAIAAIICCVLTADSMEKQAIKANVGYYELNENTGKVNFKYKQISEVEE